MKIHFIYADVGTYYYPGVHHGLAYIISVLKMHGHSVSMHHVKGEPKRKEMLDTVRKESPDLIAFSAVTNQVTNVAAWADWLKQEFDIPTICGGVHATLFPEEVIGFDAIDMVCLGEGEYPMLDLVNDLSRTDIQNIWFKKDGQVIENPLRPLIASLDDLPYPDYSLFDCEKMLKDRNGDFSIMASRGCPFSCTYCCNHALSRIYQGKGKYYRLRSADNVLDEIKLLTGTYRIKHLTFADDIFGMAREWSLDFCDKYSERFDLPFEVNARADMLDEVLLSSLKKAGCKQINMGVEAGNERLRTDILRREMSNEQIIKAYDTAHEYGFKTLAYNMIGLPYETPEMIRETINLNKRLAPSHVAVFYFYPYPGTELYEVSRKEGFLTEKSSSSYVSESILNLPSVTPGELHSLYNEFYKYVIERRVQLFPSLLRYPLRIISAAVIRLLGTHGVETLMKIYLRFFKVFSFLQNRG